MVGHANVVAAIAPRRAVRDRGGVSGVDPDPGIEPRGAPVEDTRFATIKAMRSVSLCHAVSDRIIVR